MSRAGSMSAPSPAIPVPATVQICPGPHSGAAGDDGDDDGDDGEADERAMSSPQAGASVAAQSSAATDRTGIAGLAKATPVP